MPDTIIPADKKLRMKVLCGFMLYLVVVVLINRYLAEYAAELKSLKQSDPGLAGREMKQLAIILFAWNGTISSALAAWFALVSSRIRKSDCYPYPGMKVIKNTRLRIGDEAQGVAAAYLVVAILLLATNILIWRIYSSASKLAGQ
jgi:hypothetical protein